MLNVTLCFSCVHVHSIWKRSFVSVTSNVYICGERVVFVHNLIYCCQRVFALFHLSQQLSLPMAFLPNCLQCVCPPLFVRRIFLGFFVYINAIKYTDYGIRRLGVLSHINMYVFRYYIPFIIHNEGSLSLSLRRRSMIFLSNPPYTSGL